ncbi:MAG: hypothetical protein CFH16_00651 [Alphaproteobacteria bacterium MarineAlpha5_Bin6]|nr:MAG: hypothetical protein CFH17_00215 [Alphaproteobacteria bacterium MarineAlpha5_Bin7]PPR54091.1 MAG: hypothetical protein CFH16_00651 [Alphaproteobacteria bacterium MarineAlpha5_Bin6]
MNKINLYVFSQIVKSCTLVFFIFVSIAWLMQLSRLFSIMNNFQIEFLNILGLSLWLLPNLMNITLPFVIIFGLVLTFIKFHKDKELIAIFSLGLSLNEIKKPLYILVFFSLSLYFFLNFIFSPYAYEIYKVKEFKLRNNIEFDNINISNFIEIDKNLVIDFENKNNKFEDILINFVDENNNFIYAKQGNINTTNEFLEFTLFNGFKLVINDDEIEKLQFDNYKIEFPNNVNNVYENFDKNTIGLYELLDNFNNQNIKIFTLRLFDVAIIVTIILYFYFRIIKNNNYNFKSFLIFIILAIIILTIDNFVENFNLDFSQLISICILNILIIHIMGFFLRILKIYE